MQRLLLLAALSSCTAVERIKPPSEEAEVAVTIAASTLPLTVGDKRLLVASVQNADDTRVTWTADGGSIDASGEFIAPMSPGTRRITATSVASPDKSASYEVLVIAAPDATISAPRATTAGSAGLTAAVPVQTGAMYEWALEGGTITSTDANTITFSAGSVIGTMVLTVTVTNAAGSKITQNANIAVVASTTVAITAPPIVSATTAGLTALVPQVAGATYAWNITNGTITAGETSNTITFTAGSTGNIQLSATITSASGILTGQRDIPVVPGAVATVTAPIFLTTSTTGAASVGSQNGNTYHWQITGGSIIAGENTASVSFSATSPGNVVVTVQVQNSAGDTAQGVAVVRVVDAPVATITRPAVAASGDLFSASVPGQEAAGYAWAASGCTAQGPTSGSQLTARMGSVNCALSVTVTNAAGAFTTGNATVNTASAADATIIAPASVAANSTGNTATAGTAGAYAWSIDNGSITAGATSQTVTFSAAAATGVTLRLTVTNGANAQATASRTIAVTGTVTVTHTGLGCSSVGATMQRGSAYAASSSTNPSIFLGVLAATGYTLSLPSQVTCNNATFTPTPPGIINVTSTAQPVSVTWTESNHTPTLAAIGEVKHLKSQANTDTLVTMHDDETATLTCSFSSTDTNVVPLAALSCIGNTTVRLNNANTNPGYAQVTLTVTDQGTPPLQASRTFAVVVGHQIVDTSTSLRQAIVAAANTQTITFSETANLAVENVITLNKAITLLGNGADVHSLVRSADLSAPFTIFDVKSGGALTLRSLSLDGASAGAGLGILVESGAELNLTRTHLHHHTSTGNGAAIYNQGTATIRQSALTKNRAQFGAAIYNDGGTTTLENASFFNNEATSGGGSIYVDSGTIGLSYTSMKDNAGNGASIFTVAGSVTIATSILPAGSVAGSPVVTDSYTILDDTALVTPTTTRDAIPYLLPAGAAIEAVPDCSPLSEDQRRFVRTNACDVGAIERDSND